MPPVNASAAEFTSDGPMVDERSLKSVETASTTTMESFVEVYDNEFDTEQSGDEVTRRRSKRNSRGEEYVELDQDEEAAMMTPMKQDMPEEGSLQIPDRTLLHLIGINSFAFAYGLLISTFGLITLPLEAEHFWPHKHAMLLAIYLAICGVTQLVGPASGYLSDRCQHSLGRRRPFMIAGSIVGLPSLFMLRVASLTDNLTMYLLFFFLAMTGLNIMYTAYSGALTDLVNNKQRGLANGLMGAMQVLGASAGFGCFSSFLTLETGYNFYLLVLTTALGLSLVSYTEEPTVNQHCEEASAATWREIRECYWVSPTEHRDFFLVFISRTLYYAGVSCQTFMLFYFRDVIGSTDAQADVSYLALIGQLSGALVCVPMGMLSNKVGRKPLIYLSSGILVSTYIMFMGCRTRGVAFLVGAIYGVGNGAYLSVDYALACDTLPSKDDAARYLGIWGVGAFLGTLVGPLCVGPALILFGDNGQVAEDGSPMYEVEGYIVTLFIGCAFLTAGAALVKPVRSSC